MQLCWAAHWSAVSSAPPLSIALTVIFGSAKAEPRHKTSAKPLAIEQPAARTSPIVPLPFSPFGSMANEGESASDSASAAGVRCGKAEDVAERAQKVPRCAALAVSPHLLLVDAIEYRQPRVLLVLDEGQHLLGRHRAGIAADIAEPGLKSGIVVDRGEVGADFADDRRRRAERRQQHLPAERSEARDRLGDGGPGGASSACQPSAAKPGIVSATVGRSGNCGRRCGEATAISFTCPARTAPTIPAEPPVIT